MGMEDNTAPQPQQQPQANSLGNALSKVLGLTESKPDGQVAKPAENTKPTEAEPAKKDDVTTQVDTPAATVEKKDEPTKPVQAPESLDWRNAISKEKEGDVLAAMGFDPDFIKLAQVRKSTGNLDSYFNAYKNNYKDMPPEQLIKHRIDSDSSLTAEEKALLYEDEMSVYKLDPNAGYTDQEIAVSKAKLKRDTNGYRQELLKDQETWSVKALEPLERQKAEQEHAQAKQVEAMKQFEKTLMADPMITDAIQKKSIKIGTGKDSFQLPVADAQAALDILTEKKSLNTFMVNEDGTPNIEAAFLTALFASDRKGFIKAISGHFKEKGKEDIINPMENLQPFGRNTPASTEKMSDAMYAITHGVQKRR